MVQYKLKAQQEMFRQQSRSPHQRVAYYAHKFPEPLSLHENTATAAKHRFRSYSRYPVNEAEPSHSYAKRVTGYD